VDRLDHIACQISEYLEKIEEYQRAIAKLKSKILELRWQVIETGDGEIAHYDDVA
jgi:hypothetical protein